MLKIITTIAFFICSLVFGQKAKGFMKPTRYQDAHFAIAQDLKMDESKGLFCYF
jgi:hypothetical protein